MSRHRLVGIGRFLVRAVYLAPPGKFGKILREFS